MAENDPRSTPWGMPDELKWGEVVVTPDPTQPGSPPDPFEAERDFIASVDTAHAPAASSGPRVSSAPPSRATEPPAHASYGTLPPTVPTPLPRLDTPPVPANWRSEPASTQADLRSDAPLVMRAIATDSLWGSVRSALAEPFPRGLVIGVAVAPFVALLAGFILQAVLAGGDWAHGGLAAGVDALLLGVAVAVGIGLRYAFGRRGASFTRLSSALLAALVIVGVLGLAFAHHLHYAQGQTAERTGNWAVAIAQYKLYGEAAPNAPDIARAEAAWGKQLMAAKQYSTASAHLSNALAANPKDTALAGEVTKDLYTVYSTWLADGGDGMPYGDAATFFAAYRASSACNSACQSATAEMQAQTLYLAGTQLASAGEYAQAVAEFDAIQAHLPTSSYASKAHTTGAQTYLAYGTQMLKNPDTCKGNIASAPETLTKQYQTMLSAYQTLASKYADTAEGQQAAQLLAAGQQVSGTLMGFPTNPAPTVHLSTKVDQTHLIFSNNYNVGLDAKSGIFTFASVAPGDYNLHTEQDVGYKVNFHIVHSSSGNLYNIHVGALCPLTLGQINY